MVARDMTDTRILHITTQWICSHVSEEKCCPHLHIFEVEARLYSDISKRITLSILQTTILWVTMVFKI